MAFTVVHKLDKDPKDITPDYTIDTVGEPLTQIGRASCRERV